MKYLALPIAISILFANTATASPFDIMGGPDGSTQTIHHCGYLPTTPTRYTQGPVLARVVERKLSTLGYRTTVDGYWGKIDQQAVKAFQRDYGLKPDGIVGPETAQRIAFMGHPSAHVRGCQRVASR